MISLSFLWLGDEIVHLCCITTTGRPYRRILAVLLLRIEKKKLQEDGDNGAGEQVAILRSLFSATFLDIIFFAGMFLMTIMISLWMGRHNIYITLNVGHTRLPMRTQKRMICTLLVQE